MNEPLYPITKAGLLSIINVSFKALDSVEKEHLDAASVLRATIKLCCELLVFISEDPWKDRRELLAACRTALPILRWANCHGSRCEEVVDQVISAMKETTGLDV